MFTRQEFEDHLVRSARQMAADGPLRSAAQELIVQADRYNWIHQTSWLGEPILQLPQDMFAVQQIIFKTRPRFIIESGIAWAGSLLFYATLMEVLGGERIIGIDIHIPDDLRGRVAALGKMAERITWIQGSSIAEATVAQVREVVGHCRETLVVLDSFHTHEHVLKELRTYSPLVGKGFYLVCCDTHVEDIPQIVQNRPRPWGKGNNPKTAVRQFLEENDRFAPAPAIENKLLLSLHPSGYLKCCKD